LLLETPPKIGAVAAAGRPLCIQPGQMDVQRALPDSEHVVPLSADDVADKLAAISQAPNDFPDRYALLGQSENGGVRFFAPKIALILNAFGKQTGINRRRADRGADLPHRFAYRIEECAAGVLRHGVEP
jgi:hypothetical protein